LKIYYLTLNLSFLKRYHLVLFYFFFCHRVLLAQNMDCESIISFFNKKETQIVNLNLHDPDYIPLHYLVAQDIIKDFNKFRNDVIPYYTECNIITFSELINKYDKLVTVIQQKYDSLFLLNNNVYLLFYKKALYEYQLKNEEEGKYFLDRSLQYNPVFPNAILLKLNKLLDKDRFNECLSLLNTLYYETEMDDEQEKQAIAFTDKFYDKLYKTGDSLLKMEHAAEALALFEILEVFCQNLPTAYCNDDYYHGVLKSKTGIYDSYLAIAKVAEKRGNPQIAAHFYQYAQEYVDNNPYLKDYEPKGEERYAVNGVEETTSPVTHHLSLVSQNTVSDTRYAVNGEEETTSPVTHHLSLVTQNEEQPVVAETSVAPAISPKELKDTYDDLVFQAFALCIKEDFSTSYKMFLDAKKLEDCKCFTTDFRVDLMIRELEKSGIK